MLETLVKQGVRRMKCRRCKQDKDAKHFYANSRNKTGLEYICKPCKSIEINSRRYKISESFLEYLYSYENCMCCDEPFLNNKCRHIHHTTDGVQGLVCIHCNHILGQETDEDLQRINKVLAYMKLPRKNLLDRDNQQERLRNMGRLTQVVEESSETIRCETLVCSQCNRQLTLESFPKRSTNAYRKVCLDCRASNVRLSQSKQATHIRNNSQICVCCGCELTSKKCVHHVVDTVIGVLCCQCNQLLRNESKQQRDRLLNCKLWIESQGSMIESVLHGDMQS